MQQAFGSWLLSFTIVALACAGPVAPDRSQQEWDQAAVTALARELAQAAGDVRNSVRREPTTVPVGARRVRTQTIDDLRVAQVSIRSLARQLEGGAGRLETYPTFRRIQLLRRKIARNVMRALLTEPTPSKLEAARVILEQLEPFYAAEAAAYEAEGL